ncbi:MAG: hypothetical protein IPH03_17035 [Tetrasphaera sp.]|nr:hypothetical protein [Tetrasphaera sp.]
MPVQIGLRGQSFHDAGGGLASPADGDGASARPHLGYCGLRAVDGDLRIEPKMDCRFRFVNDTLKGKAAVAELVTIQQSIQGCRRGCG